MNSVPRFVAPSACMVWFASGCFAPEVDGPCVVRCSLGCPDGWGCNNAYCVPPGYASSCESAAGALGTGGGISSAAGGTAASAGGRAPIALGGAGNFGLGGEIESGAAAVGGSSNPTSGTGGRVGNDGGIGGNDGGDSGGVGVGGVGGVGGAAPIDIQLMQTGSLCSGDVSLAFSATGGKPPYQWTPESTCGLSLVPGGDGVMHLNGQATAGDCVIALSVADSSSAARGAWRRSITFHAPPTLDATKLASACLFEQFEAGLTSSGGDAASRRFETNTPGWSIVGNKLRTNVNAQTQRKVSVSVRDDYCASPPVELELSLETGPEHCFTTNPVPKPLADAPENSLPRPCAGMAYPLRIELKPEPASWKLLMVPPGLKAPDGPSDPSAIVLEGTASWPAGDKSTLQFQLVRSDGRQFLYDYDLIPRNKCWVGYVGREQDLWQLLLVDPELWVKQAFGPRDAEVKNLAFSPDGNFVVYQSARAAIVGLTLVNLRNLREQALSFTGNVEHYVWSPDGSLLAVVSRDTGTILGGIDVSGVSTSTQIEPGIQGVTYLQPSVTEIEGAPVWFGQRALAMAVLAPEGRWTTRFVRASGNGYSAVTDQTKPTYNRPTLLGFPGGYLAGDGFLLDFYAGTGMSQTRYPHARSSAAVAPTGVYVANIIGDGQLRWFDTSKAESDVSRVAQSEPGQCHALLAWTDAGNRNACVTGDAAGSLRFLERASADTVSLSMTTNTTSYNYSEQSSVARRRVFSQDGTRFAFTTSLDVNVVDMNDGRFFRKYLAPILATEAEQAKQGDTIDLAFSADARFLAEHRARRLTVALLSDESGGSRPLDTEMLLAPSCTESYLAAPVAWCGARSAPRDFRWSAHSPWLAFVNGAGALFISYLSTGSRAPVADRINTSCTGECIRSFDFQP